MTLIVHTTGSVQCLHSDLIPLQTLGTMTVKRASHVDFDEATQQWQVWPARSVVGGKPLYSNVSRAACLAFEDNNWELFL